MKLGIMQPYIFPYIGYYSLINYVDEFIFFDTPQYIRKGWINRNRILRADGQPDYFTIPVEKHARETPINQVRIKRNTQWRDKIWGQLTVYKRRAPHYDVVIDLVRDVFENEEMISSLAIKSIRKTCQYIGIETPFNTFSEMGLQIGNVEAPDEWALEITKATGYHTYVNPPGGMKFFDRDKYAKEGIELLFLEAGLTKYNQRIGRFEPGLSIVDIMMFLEPVEIRDLLQDYSIK